MKKKNSTAQRKKVKFDNKHLNDPIIKKVYLTFKKQLYSQIKNEKFCIGVSGGPDSLALAFLCKIFSKEFNSKFIALIIDHNLRKQSATEAQKVKIILTKHKIRAKILTWKGKIPKSNIQFNARNIRYFLLNNECNKLNIKNLVLAHHEGDLIENFFIRLFRGSGLKGLSSLNIKRHSEDNILSLIRPLINTKKNELIYITKKVFKFYLTDPSNFKEKFLRTRVRNYLDWMIDIPWYKKDDINIDLNKAIKILDEDHFGLEKIKERIIEFLAVQKRMEKLKGPILCLVGPPGVGKTSLGKSIARATNRQFIRMSLGGVRDEAEVRGHRRTYIGSLPGKIIQMMKKAGTKNPLFLLDEIDKVGNDYRGDPSSALLEALDPEQNTTFNDHYLEVDYDLSDVMFVTTANTLNILPPLLDRMEVIRLPGYTEDEKINIANNFLLPKQIKNNGVKDGELILSDGTIKEIIRSYTKESGVRNLEREISKIARKVVKKVVSKEETKVSVSDKNLSTFLGVKKFKFGELESENKIGVVTGLAWTEYGGEILKIETVNMPGKGRMQITGKLGDVMQESVKAAKSYVRSKSLEYGIIPPTFEKKDFHIHVPEGATPKDGPSAGIGMVTSIVSSITKIPVNKEIAMTGEVTLTGQVLPIGGLKEKLLAAHRAGIKQVVIPKDNEKDLVDIPQKVKDDIKITPVEVVDEVLKLALTKEFKKVEWVEVENITKSKEDKSQASIQ